MRRGLCTALFLLLLALVCPACLVDDPISPLEPVFFITSPASDSRLPAGPVEVVVFIENFQLMDKIGQANVPGEGHIIYYLDVLPPIFTGVTATAAGGTFVVSTARRYTWPDLRPGRHILSVQLVNNDNTPLRPPNVIHVDILAR